MKMTSTAMKAATNMYNIGKREGMQLGIRLTLLAGAITLTDKHNFNAELLQETDGEIKKLCTEITEGRLTYEDIETALLEEYGIDLRRK